MKSHGWNTMSSKQLPDEIIAVPKNAILDTPLIPDTAAATSIDKLQINHEDDLPVQPVFDNDLNDDNGSQINRNPPIQYDVKQEVSKLMCPLPTNRIKQMSVEEGPLKNTTGHMILEKKKGFNYCALPSELMYAYITCCPDIGYAVTTLSKFSSAPTEYHFTLLKGVAIYLRNTIEWDIRFHRKLKLQYPDFQPSTWYNIPIKPLKNQIFDVDINCPILSGFVDVAHANELQK